MDYTKEAPFRFLELPLELQEKVITFAATSCSVITYRNEAIHIETRFSVNLLLVCRYFSQNVKTTVRKVSPSRVIFTEVVEGGLPAQSNALQRYLRSGGFSDRYRDSIQHVSTRFSITSLQTWVAKFPTLQTLCLNDNHISIHDSVRGYGQHRRREVRQLPHCESAETSALSTLEVIRRQILCSPKADSCWNDDVLRFDCHHEECCYDPYVFSLADTLNGNCTVSSMIRSVWTARAKWWAWRAFSFGQDRKTLPQWTQGHPIQNVTISRSYLVQINLPDTLWSEERKQLGLDEDLLVINFEYSVGNQLRTTLTSMNLRKAKGFHKKCFGCERVTAAG